MVYIHKSIDVLRRLFAALRKCISENKSALSQKAQ